MALQANINMQLDTLRRLTANDTLEVESVGGRTKYLTQKDENGKTRTVCPLGATSDQIYMGLEQLISAHYSLRSITKEMA